MFEGHPKGLWALALANTGERFGYYTMLAVFALFLRENFGLESSTAGLIYSTFLCFVYFMPLIGGFMADKFGFGKMVTIGISIMFIGYLLLSLPLGGDTFAMVVMMASLLLISLGTGLFKGNLQVMVGNLYDDAKYSNKRDSGFSLFYMAINIGALFAPTAALAIKEYAETELGYSSNDAYHFSFAVACASLVISILIYKAFRKTFRHVEGGAKQGDAKGANVAQETLSKAETKQRVIALCLVFAVVIFFWMAFHQNGLTLTYFADEFVEPTSAGIQSMPFDVWNLILIIVAVYATFSIFQSKTSKAKMISGSIGTAVLAFLAYRAANVGDATIDVSAPIFQQFNPFYVVALTPVSMAIFSALAAKGKEPSAPRKIAYGMVVAAAGFAIILLGSKGLNTPDEQQPALALNKAKEFSTECYAYAPEVKKQGDEYMLMNTEGKEITDQEIKALKKTDKDLSDNLKKTKDYLGKLNETTGPIFVDVYNANVTILSAEPVATPDVAIESTANELDTTTPTTTEPVVETVSEEVPATDVLPCVAPGPDAGGKVATDVIPAKDPVETAKETLSSIEKDSKSLTFTSPYWLILTYLVLTFAELLLSPMGISFVSKVAPPKLKGMMMGGWFVATAIGNLLVSVGGFLWAGIPLTYVWAVFIVLCLLSALFMFAMMKRLEKVAK